MRRRAVGAALALGVAASACEREVPHVWHEETGYRWRELDVPDGEPGFTRMEGRRGAIRFQNTVSDSLLLGNRVLGQGGGVAIGDVDGDGLPDVFLARTQGCSALFRNLGGWRFDDITARAGVGACDRHATGAALADVDGDGDLDLVLLATRGPNAIFVNDGGGRFTERRDLGLDPTGKGGTTLTLADVDGDGQLDLYVANYKPYSIDDSLPPQRRSFAQMVRQVGPNRFEIAPEHQGEYKLVLRPDMGGLRVTARGAPDDFYRNVGGRFERVPLTSDRFRDAAGKPLAEEPESFTLAARFGDLNGDGAPDLYVANDFEDRNELWYNDGRGGFRLADWTALRQMSNSTMGVDFGDVSGDGLPDVFETDMLANDSRRLKTQIPTHTPLPKRPGDMETQLQQQRNALFVNRGDGTFAEASLYAGVQASGWSWGTILLDVDLDGWQDILIANGHLWDIMDADVQEGLPTRARDIPWQRLRWEFPRLAERNVAFRNRGDLTFEDASERWRFGVDEDISHALAAGDLDGDGDLDIVVNRLGAPALVLRNDTPAPRVAVRLAGDAPNTRAVGATIRLLPPSRTGGVEAGNGGAGVSGPDAAGDGGPARGTDAAPIQVREVAAGGLYLSHSDYLASFAMGSADSATLVIDWRDGRRTTIAHVRPNRLYEVTTATAAARPAADSLGSGGDSTLFTDVTAMLGGHTHDDPPFDDWQRQFLLPNSVAHLGPGVAWFDHDRDGDEDLVVGAGRGGRVAIFRNDRGRLSAAPGEGPVAPADFTTILGLAGRDGVRLLAGVSSWELSAAAPLPAAVAIGVTRSGLAGGADPLVEPLEGATGPLALGDYDSDGDLDLFVGGRAIPGRYPAAASSMLYRNDGGRFAADTTTASALRGVGLVSAALFSDVDGDGRPDLVLAREWDSILLLLNRGGRFEAAPESWGLARWTSRWNGVASGDLDGDGRLDLVATSWGRNTMMGADSVRPLVAVHGALGQRGGHEMLIARHDPRLGALTPLNGYGRVREVMPDLASRVRSFAAYADATLDQVLGPRAGAAERMSVVTLDHMTFMNRGDRFEAVPLPREAQLAPAFFAGIADFDGDGREDVFLSQNFYATAVGLPRYDGGRGLLLLGDGRGGLRAIPARESGVRAYGDQRGAAYADFDGDGRLDLAVSQNAGPTRLFRNRAAMPGLRVRVQGPQSNPDGIGVQLRIVYGDRMGPVREIQAGSGYWSQNGATQVMGLESGPGAVWVRWPGGRETRTTVPVGARKIVVRAEPR